MLVLCIGASSLESYATYMSLIRLSYVTNAWYSARDHLEMRMGFRYTYCSFERSSGDREYRTAERYLL
jgi:hypothetical protein